jgi:hypothetical protein
MIARQDVKPADLAGQAELPGCAPDIAGTLQRKANAPLKPAKPQEACDVGLFADRQMDLADRQDIKRANQ